MNEPLKPLVTQAVRVQLVRDTSVQFRSNRMLCCEHAAEVVDEYTHDWPCERVIALALDGHSRIKAVTMLAQGGMHGCALTARDVFTFALLSQAVTLILGHNHPSGDPTPSRDDITMTRQLKAAGQVLGIPLLDHVVVARDNAGKLNSCSVNDYL